MVDGYGDGGGRMEVGGRYGMVWYEVRVYRWGGKVNGRRWSDMPSFFCFTDWGFLFLLFLN